MSHPFYEQEEGQIMRSLTCLVIVAGVLAVAGFGLATLQAADGGITQNQDQSRYTFHNGEWWYWMPEGRWVYWRDNQWNNYDPKTFTSNNAVPAATGSVPSNSANGAIDDADNRPFYGHAVADPDKRPLQPNGEVGPFYGRELPKEGPAPKHDDSPIGPFYGHGD
jgi:hypothetical protein